MAEHSRKHVGKRHAKHKSSLDGLQKNMKKENVWFYISIVLAALLLIAVISAIRRPADMTEGSTTGDTADQLDGTTVNEPITVTPEKETFIDRVKEFFAGGTTKTTNSNVDTSKTGVANFDLYVMSQCPYGTVAMDEAIGAKKRLGNAMDLNIEYIFYDQSQYAGQEDNYCIEEICSMHGVNEVKGDIYELCALDQDKDKAYDMILCMNENAGAIPGNWESCAKDAGLDTAAIQSCYDSPKGLDLARKTKAASQAAGASGSPTIIVDGARYSGARDELSFTIQMCSLLKDHPACNTLPECTTSAQCTGEPGKIGVCQDEKCTYKDPVEFTMTIISDKICTDCAASVAQNKVALQNLFVGIKYKELDYSDPEAQALMEKYNIDTLPALIADKKIAETGPWLGGAINTAAFQEMDDAYVVIPQVIGATHKPTSEICDNGVDDRDQDGLIDCADDECANQMVCREEMPKNLQLFIMSDCPYGKVAVEALYEVVQNFGDAMDYEIHYIANENPDGSFNSLHGAYEAEEDMRQLCVKEHAPEAWLDYVNCRSVNGVKGNDWNSCADEAGIADKAAIETCVSGDEGKALLSEDIKQAQALSISASPTWLANNRYQFSGLSAEAAKQSFCQYNTGLAGCENTLSGTAAAASGSC